MTLYRKPRWTHVWLEGVTSAAKRLVPGRFLPAALDLYGRMNALGYAGRNVICPCCDGTFRKFKAYGSVKREGVLCPRCRSFPRHRILWLYLEQRTDFFTAELDVLHFAPEYKLREAFGALPNLRYVSADLNSPLADTRTDITDIACADEEFDVVLCVHVLEHVVDDRRALSEIKRVMKPGGWAIIAVPIDSGREKTFEVPGADSPAERLHFFGKKDHLRVYGRDFDERLAEAGFLVMREDFARELGGGAARRYGLAPSAEVYLCKKTEGRVPCSGKAKKIGES